jgi:DNA-binding transcriptional regulator YiaG
MSNVGKVLKTEITRISRKEIKAAIGQIGKSHTNLKKTVIDLKRRLALLEKENRRLVAGTRKPKTELLQEPSEEGVKGRFTSKGIRNLRSKLRLTQADFGRLVGTTPHSVHLWEKKDGSLRLRDRTKAALLSIRGLGVKEAKARLERIGGKQKRSRKMRGKS